jgi:DNA-binding transcriptional MerR regulator
MRKQININTAALPAEMTRTEVVKILGITYTTLEYWIAKGRISPGRKVFSNRVFTKAEVIKALK